MPTPMLSPMLSPVLSPIQGLCSGGDSGAVPVPGLEHTRLEPPRDLYGEQRRQRCPPALSPQQENPNLDQQEDRRRLDERRSLWSGIGPAHLKAATAFRARWQLQKCPYPQKSPSSCHHPLSSSPVITPLLDPRVSRLHCAFRFRHPDASS